MKELNYSRKTSIIVGILFIIGTVAGILSAVFIGSILYASDFLVNVSNTQHLFQLFQKLN